MLHKNKYKDFQMEHIIILVFVLMMILQFSFAMIGGLGNPWENGYDVTWIVRRLIGSGKYSFLGYMFISYFMMRYYDKNRRSLGTLAVLYVIHYGMFALFSFVIVQALHVLYFEYALFIMKALFLYIILPAVLASVIGTCIGMLSDTVKAGVSALIVLFLFTTNIFSRFMIYSFDIQGMESSPSMYYLWDVFSLSGGRTDIYDDYYYTLSLGTVDFEKIAMWIVISFFVFVWLKKELKGRKIVMSCLSVLAVCFAVLYFQPASKYVVYAECPYDSWNWDDYSGITYQPAGPDSVPFAVEKYDIRISVGRDMTAKVSLIPDNTGLKSYEFSLYHGFEVESITDYNDKKLEYVRKGNSIIVYADEASDCSVLNFRYKGGSNYNIANKQCIYLTENIAFYPITGFEERVYSDALRNISHYNVEIDTSLKVYCNLGISDNNHFEGDAEGIMLYGGMLLRETAAEGVRIVYPALRWSEQQICDEYRNVCELYKKAGYDLSGKDWFVTTFRTAKDTELFNGQGYFCGSVEYMNNAVRHFISMRGKE